MLCVFVWWGVGRGGFSLGQVLKAGGLGAMHRVK